jgi:hypothetical protein
MWSDEGTACCYLPLMLSNLYHVWHVGHLHLPFLVYFILDCAVPMLCLRLDTFQSPAPFHKPRERHGLHRVQLALEIWAGGFCGIVSLSCYLRKHEMQ